MDKATCPKWVCWKSGNVTRRRSAPSSWRNVPPTKYKNGSILNLVIFDTQNTSKKGKTNQELQEEFRINFEAKIGGN